ncbi:MAG TPA: DUF72 domain-containing protein [Thermoanaerobaculia bacterium]|nr:DUF72 domain-containing protein [Thermoanaerobaculia bacterium]
MRVITGTSGYSYKEWKGTFYPSDLPASKMLSFYAGHFGSVEINATFYRMPEAKTLAKWATEVPDTFTFVLKAPQRITHQKKLVGIEDDLHFFFDTAATLGSQLGPILFQLPPYFKKDIDKLRGLLSRLPEGTRAALETRHDSWLSDDVYDVLREHDAAFVAADTDEIEDPATIFTPTASWGYLRLRRSDYSDQQLKDWARRVEGTSWSDAYVFFKHEDEGKGPAFAKRFEAELPPR